MWKSFDDEKPFENVDVLVVSADGRMWELPSADFSAVGRED